MWKIKNKPDDFIILQANKFPLSELEPVTKHSRYIEIDTYRDFDLPWKRQYVLKPWRRFCPCLTKKERLKTVITKHLIC